MHVKVIELSLTHTVLEHLTMLEMELLSTRVLYTVDSNGKLLYEQTIGLATQTQMNATCTQTAATGRS